MPGPGVSRRIPAVVLATAGKNDRRPGHPPGLGHHVIGNGSNTSLDSHATRLHTRRRIIDLASHKEVGETWRECGSPTSPLPPASPPPPSRWCSTTGPRGSRRSTRDRVRRAAAEVGYTPNSVARGLRTQRSHTVGLISDRIATTPFAGRMLAGAQDVAREHGYLVFLVDTGGGRDRGARGDPRPGRPAGRRDDLRLHVAPGGRCRRRRCREAPCSSTAAPRTAASRRSCPTTGPAASRRCARSSQPDTVGSPTSTSTSGTLRRLRPAPRGVPRGARRGRDRRRTRRCTSAGRHVVRRRARRPRTALLDLPQERRPTALFCFNDRMAAGAYVAAHRRGLRDPPGPLDRRVRRPAARRGGPRPPADHRRAAALRDGPVGDGGRPRHQDAGRPRRPTPHALPDRRSGLGGSAAGHSCERQPATDLTRNPQRPPSVAVER